MLTKNLGFKKQLLIKTYLMKTDKKEQTYESFISVVMALWEYVSKIKRFNLNNFYIISHLNIQIEKNAL